MGYRYIAYGLSINSEIPLPELPQIEDGEGNIDLTIRLGEVPRWSSAGGGTFNGMRWVDSAHFWFHAAEVAHYYVSNGDEIVVMMDRSADMTMLRLYLFGTVFGAALRQRGLLVLHGNAIRIGDACAICVGASGAGKSTLAAAFLLRGFEVIADDVVPVDENASVVAGFPRMKLWQNAVDNLGLSTEGLSRVATGIEKFSIPLIDFDPYLTLPLKWIYLLCPEETDRFVVESFVGSAQFQVLKDNSYRDDFVSDVTMIAEHLMQCSSLAKRVQISKIIRPQKGFQIERLIDTILDDINIKSYVLTSSQ